jgi:hypothetical protein
VVINLVPFVYAFLALMTLPRATTVHRLAGAVGAVVTAAGMIAVFLPTGDVGDVWVFELKMAAGVGVPILAGLWLYGKSRIRPGVRPA